MSCPDCPPPRWRRRVLLALAVAVALGLATADLLGAPVARRGRVERVERPRFASRAALRTCGLSPSADDRLTCFGGSPPEVGTRYALVDEHGFRAAGDVVRTEPSAQDNCKLGGMYDVVLAYEGGALSPRPQGYTTTYGIQGVAVDRRARIFTDPALRAPSGKDGEQIWVSIDRDGDSQVDLVATYFDCTRELRDLPRPVTPASTVQAYCMDYWLKDGASWNRLNHEIYLACW